MKKGREKTTQVRGIIIPIDWDDSGNVIGISLSSHEEVEYLIEKDKLGKELLSLIRKEVEVRGVITETEQGGKKGIKIKKYMLTTGIQPEPPPVKELKFPS